MASPKPIDYLVHFNMKANALAVLQIFETKTQLEVPLFQRQYVWKEFTQWAPLWEDISHKFGDHLDGKTTAPPHFLGAIVLDQKLTPTGFVERRQIIDGQQRLTTLQIFLAAFRDFCTEHGQVELAQECEKFILNKGIMADQESQQFKVRPTQLDRAQFQDVILSGSRTEVERRHPIVRRKFKHHPEPRPLMVGAYLFFSERFAEFFLGTTETPAYKQDLSIAVRLEECLKALRNSILVVAIDLDKEDEAQVIFESLNARGVPLLPADLVRNYIFLRAARQNQDQEKLYDEFWRGFDDEFWTKPVQKSDRPRSDLFMQYFLSSRVCDEIAIKHLFVEYKYWIEKAAPFPTVRDELEALSRQGADFRRLVVPKEGDLLEPFSNFLRDFELGTAYPFLLAVLDARPNDSDLMAITSILESYAVRRSVCNLTTKNYNRVFLQLTRSMQGGDFSPSRVATYLESLRGDSVEWPSDDQFREAWMNGKVYEYMPNPRIVHVLKRLSDSYMGPKVESLRIETSSTIEHILPRTWLENWPLQDGSPGMGWDELAAAPEGDPRAVATRRRDNLLHTFGNLTLLTQPLNSAVSNGSWALKKPEILRASLLPLNQQLYGVVTWDEDAILARGRELYSRALKLWSPPGSKTTMKPEISGGE